AAQILQSACQLSQRHYPFVLKVLFLDLLQQAAGWRPPFHQLVVDFADSHRHARGALMSNTEQDRMLGESASFLQTQEQISRLAPLNKPVLIIGERGTGKELVAARLHYLSKRWDQSFIKVNCAAFS